MFHPNGGMFPPGYYGPYSHMMPVPSPFVAASHQSTEEVSALREQLVISLLLFFLHYFK
jgi:hypothetical protein